ncbi:Peptidase S1 domain-containing protein [Entamoeba marina]
MQVLPLLLSLAVAFSCTHFVQLHIEDFPQIITSNNVSTTCFYLPQIPLLFITKHGVLFYHNTISTILHTQPVSIDINYSSTDNQIVEDNIVKWNHPNNGLLHIQKLTDNTCYTPQILTAPVSSPPLTFYNNYYGTFYKIIGNATYRVTAVGITPLSTKRIEAVIYSFHECLDIEEEQMGEALLDVDGEQTIFVGMKEKDCIISAYASICETIGGNTCEKATIMNIPFSVVDYKKESGDIEVWYAVYGNSQDLIIETCGEESQFDTFVSVVDQCNGNIVGSSDDACGIQARVYLHASEQMYYILVTHGLRAIDKDGTFRLSVYSQNTPTNSICSNALSLNELQVGSFHYVPLINGSKKLFYLFTSTTPGILYVNTCDVITNVINEIGNIDTCDNLHVISLTNDSNICGRYGKYSSYPVSKNQQLLLFIQTQSSGFVHIETFFQPDDAYQNLRFIVQIAITIIILLLVTLILYVPCWRTRIYYDM